MPRQHAYVGPDRTEAVVDFFAASPATYHELAAALGWGLDYARYVCRSLQIEGFLVGVGKRAAKTRPRTVYALNAAPVGQWWDLPAARRAA